MFLVNSKMLLRRACLPSQWENACIDVQSCTDDTKLMMLCFFFNAGKIFRHPKDAVTVLLLVKQLNCDINQ